MARKMLKFVNIAARGPDKRGGRERIGDYREIFAEFTPEEAGQQASRCSQCGIPFCQIHCPLHNNIPDWLKLAAEDRIEEAYELAQATNSFPEICGRICPHDRLCEGNCVIAGGFGTVSIGPVEKYITDRAWEMGLVKPPAPRIERAQSVGIIGAGPAGLAAAEKLRRKGYRVEVYDRHDRVGGLLVYGIPNFKLDKQVVARRAQLLRDGGVTFHLEFAVGGDASLDELRDRHDAILIATGVYKARELQVPGAGSEGVFAAMTYLIASNRKGLGDRVPAFDDGRLDARGKRVVVIGGGDTAMDCVRTAVRQGAAAITCLYRRDRDNMPGSMREVAHAEEEGVDFVWLASPKAILDADGVSGVRAVRMRLGRADAGGRRTPRAVDGSGFTLEAGMVIEALGFDPEELTTLFGAPELHVTRWGTVDIDFKTMMTNLDGVFAAGDIVRGASLVVWAIKDGRDAAEAMHVYLRNRAVLAEAS